MKKRTNKKGFTLVELLVVIAILAVLASVSVIGYLGFTKKAKVSNDVGLTTQMNRILQAEEAGGETFDTPHDAITALKEGGLDVTKLTPTTDGYSYVYDVNGTNGQKMILVDENKNVIAPEGASIDSSKAERYFFFAGTEDEVTNYTKKGYSVYLKDGFTTTTALKVKAGLDVGSNEGIGVELTSSEAKTYLFRTNGETLTVNAENATVHHYGSSLKVKITAVASNSYHENGTVVGNIEVKKGRVELNENANVSTILVESEQEGDVKVDVVSGAKVGTVAPTTEVAKKDIETSSTIPNDSKVTEIVETTNNDKFAGGLGTEKSPYLISNEEEFDNIFTERSQELLNDLNSNTELKFFLAAHQIGVHKHIYN